MGACDFTDVATGKTPQEAFQKAHDDACWEHGHGGYSGSIAEKGSFTLFTIPPRMSPDKLMDWVWKCGEIDSEWPKEDLALAKRWAAEAGPGKKRAAQARVREAERRLKEHEKAVAKFKKEVGPHFDLLKKMARVADDKWGPAVCIEVTSPTQKKKYASSWPISSNGGLKRGERIFIFFGMASS